MDKPKMYSHCRVCGRRLKNPKWKRVGIGPECYEKYRKKKDSRQAVQLEMNFG